jgi:hypothetical protein
LEELPLYHEKPSEEDLKEYITWTLSQDAAKNPAIDFTGERAARTQGRYPVWFIPGTTTNEDKITRACDVPSDTEILILAATSDSSYLEHKGARNDGQLRTIAEETAKLHKGVKIIIRDESGKEKEFGVEDASKRKEGEGLQIISKAAFPIIIPENNIYKQLYGVRGGYTHLAVAALGIKVKLTPGKYTLVMKARHDGTPPDQPLEIDGLKIDVPRFNLDIEYKLTVRDTTSIQGREKPQNPFANYPE